MDSDWGVTQVCMCVKADEQIFEDNVKIMKMTPFPIIKLTFQIFWIRFNEDLNPPGAYDFPFVMPEL